MKRPASSSPVSASDEQSKWKRFRGEDGNDELFHGDEDHNEGDEGEESEGGELDVEQDSDGDDVEVNKVEQDGDDADR